MCYRQIPSQYAERTERSSRQHANGDAERRERGEHQERGQEDKRRHEERVEEVEAVE